MTTKQQVLDRYQAMAEQQYPGKGQLGRQILENGWDQGADRDVEPSTLRAMQMDAITDKWALSVARGICVRHPEVVTALKNLKG